MGCRSKLYWIKAAQAARSGAPYGPAAWAPVSGRADRAATRADTHRCRHSQYRQRVDPISALDWLLNRGVNAFIRVDPGRDGRRPGTFFASDGPLKDQPIRIDADSRRIAYAWPAASSQNTA
jgi:hypothetical protein